MPRKRDMDLIRSLMLEIEEGKEAFDPDDYEDADWSEKTMHIRLIEEAGWVKFSHELDDTWAIDRITGKGHDFLDSVRDPVIWAKTKEGAAKAGGFTLDLIGALAKGFLKKQVQDRTGVELEF